MLISKIGVETVYDGVSNETKLTDAVAAFSNTANILTFKAVFSFAVAVEVDNPAKTADILFVATFITSLVISVRSNIFSSKFATLVNSVFEAVVLILTVAITPTEFAAVGTIFSILVSAVVHEFLLLSQ